MNIAQLNAFLKFSDLKNITEAANYIGISQPRMSQRLKEFEDSLDVKLIVRNGRKVELSPAGERLVPYAREILKLCDEAAAVARGIDLSKRQIRIGAPESVCTYFVPSGIQALRDCYPDTTAHLVPGASDELVASLRRGDIDIAFILSPEIQPSGLKCEKLAQFELIPVTSNQRQTILSMYDFSQENVFVTEQGCSYRRLIEIGFEQRGARLNHTTEMISVEAIKRCVEADGGVSILPFFALEKEIQSEQLKRVKLPGFNGTITLQAITQKGSPFARQLELFVEAIKQSAKAITHTGVVGR